LAVRIRLTRTGATKRPSYRVVAIESRRPRDGRALEILGTYDPLTDPATVRLEEDRIRQWMARGAKPSDAVMRVMRQAGMAEGGARPATTPKGPARRKRAKGGEPNGAEAEGLTAQAATAKADSPTAKTTRTRTARPKPPKAESAGSEPEEKESA
jgi:small subunit ribosomal protein S16